MENATAGEAVLPERRSFRTAAEPGDWYLQQKCDNRFGQQWCIGIYIRITEVIDMEINYKSRREFYMSETMKTIRTRRSIRKFQEKMPERELIDRVIEAGTYAATGMGRQSPIIVAVLNKEVRDKLSRMNAEIMGAAEGMDPFYGAPVVLIVLADKAMPTYVYDGSLVMGNLMLAAKDAGLGSCWIHRAKEEFESEEGKALLKSLGITGDYEGIGHCVLGYVDGDEPEAAPRKDDYVYYVE